MGGGRSHEASIIWASWIAPGTQAEKLMAAKPSPLSPALEHDEHYRQALAAFRQDHPEFDADALADLRARDYSRLDDLGHVYLDYTGGGLYAQSQLDALKLARGRG